MQLSPASPYPVQYDLSNCANEPINFIATFQAHACLVACRASDWTVTQASSNSFPLLGLHLEAVLHQRFFDQIPDSAAASILTAIAKGSEYLAANPVQVNFSRNGQPNWLNCLIHPQGEQVIFEFEPFDEDVLDFSVQRKLSGAMQRIQHCESLAAVLQASAEELKSIIGYDRVMIYRFDEEGHGMVAAEAREPHLEPLLGLHYPASDIPAQARALFMKNPARIITDVNTTPALIQPPVSPVTGQPLDLTDCTGRGVSPIHLEYLGNMGVRASMSIAIVFEEKLWGLIACHHYSPKVTGHFKRHTAWFLGQVIGTHLGLKSVAAYRQSVMKAGTIKSKLFEQMSVNWDLFEGLAKGSTTLLDLTDCGGAAIYHEGKLALLGKTPDKAAVVKLMHWMDDEISAVVFGTHELPRRYPPAAAWKGVAAGLLAVRLSNVPGDYLLWFRPEVVQTVHWSGNPEKAVTKEAGNIRLSPRKSFEKWSQLVEGTSQPWQAFELEAALALRNDVKDFIFQKYREVQQTNRELTEAYDDLEAFSYSISHDLRAPLRTIGGYADLLKENYGEVLDEGGQHLLETIKDNSAKLTDLISGLLAYTRAGKKNLILNHIPLGEVVRHELKPLMDIARQQGRAIELQISEDLPTVVADKPALVILIKNLLSNAFKYTAHSNPSIIEIGGSAANGAAQFYIKDNGIGFDMQHAGRIFGVFNRLVNDEHFEGTGIGLAIVKRIIEKHNGSITVKSTPNKGTAFFVRLPIATE